MALTRKNALFAGSDGGAEHWAVVASLVETCKRAGVEPFAYLADDITRIVAGHPNSRLDELLPWAYQPRMTSEPWPDDDAYDKTDFGVGRYGTGGYANVDCPFTPAPLL